MMYERIVLTTLLYGAETWGLNARENRRLIMMEMEFLRVGMRSDLSGRVEKCVPMWFGHVERMNGESVAKKKYNSVVKRDAS